MIDYITSYTLHVCSSNFKHDECKLTSLAIKSQFLLSHYILTVFLHVDAHLYSLRLMSND